MASPLQDKSKAIALEIIKGCNEVKRTKRESVLTERESLRLCAAVVGKTAASPRR